MGSNRMIGHDQRWTPGIGDPSVMGWVTVACYFLIAFCCLLVRKIEPLDHSTDNNQLINYRKFWWVLAACLTFLGINKQLDLQSIAGCAWLTYKLRNACGTIKLALLGFSLLLAFVVIRAASFHNFDYLLRYQIAGLKFNWLMEIGTLIIIAISALSFRKKYI